METFAKNVENEKQKYRWENMVHAIMEVYNETFRQ
jgi:hypothetical protein